MNALNTVLIVSHVTAALTAIAIATTIFFRTKGDSQHRNLGNIYFTLIMFVLLCAGVLSVTRVFFIFTVGLAILSWYLSYTGIQAFEQQPRRATVFDWLITLAIMGFAVLLLIHGFRNTAHDIYGPMGIIYGSLMGYHGGRDIVRYLRPRSTRGWRLYYHIERMFCSYATALTAMTTQIGKHAPDGVQWFLWLIPTGTLIVIAFIWIRYYAGADKAFAPVLEPAGNRPA